MSATGRALNSSDIHKMHHHSDLFHALLHGKLSDAKWRKASPVKWIIMTENHPRK